jgi:hypothetical protein
MEMQTRRKVPRWFPMLYLSPLSPHSPALLPCKCTLESAAPEIIHSSKPELHVSNAFKKSEEGTTRNSSIPGPSASSPKTQPDGQRQNCCLSQLYPTLSPALRLFKRPSAPSMKSSLQCTEKSPHTTLRY